jgi:ADP-ribose pyrophosphatase YjhB (NUDIX family)
MNHIFLNHAKRIHAIAQAGLHYTESDYDRDRYAELLDLSRQMLAELTDIKVEKIADFFAGEDGYPTPKVDIRAVVIRDDQILMVKEKIDGCWSLPGGWADVGYTPAAVAEKETLEEAGLEVKASRLLAILDKSEHKHPPDFFYTYKIFILCEIIGGEVTAGMETTDAGFFALTELPILSENRITLAQIEMMFDLYRNSDKPAIFD